MLGKIGRDMVIVFCITALWVSTSRTAMQYISEHRNVDKWWGAYDWRHGDLSGMSYLDFVKKFRTSQNYSGNRPIYNTTKHTVLFLQGDSHTRNPQLKASDFAGVSEFHFINRGQNYHYHIDTTKSNVLIIEISERHVRDYFADLKVLNEIYDTIQRKKSISVFHSPCNMKTKYCSFFSEINFICFFNKYINQNLECNLFNYNFIAPVFECKAAMNYYLFSRASGDVIISEDKQFLFYKETVTSTGRPSSFSFLSDTEKNNIIDNLNSIYNHYKADGFKEVYLSIIPNTASVMQPKRYNHLIPLIQNDVHLKIKTIDVYSLYKNEPVLYFLQGDTHWNDNGFLLWLKTVNGILANQNLSK